MVLFADVVDLILYSVLYTFTCAAPCWEESEHANALLGNVMPNLQWLCIILDSKLFEVITSYTLNYLIASAIHTLNVGQTYLIHSGPHNH